MGTVTSPNEMRVRWRCSSRITHIDNTILLIKRKDESKMQDKNDKVISPKSKCIIKLLYTYESKTYIEVSQYSDICELNGMLTRAGRRYFITLFIYDFSR
jgi:hypothetical protein